MSDVADTFAKKYADRFEVVDRTFVWTTNDAEPVKISLPLRVPMKTFMKFDEMELGRSVMLEFLADLLPEGGRDALLEQDGNDLMAMFLTWREVYADGVSLGESEASPA